MVTLSSSVFPPSVLSKAAAARGPVTAFLDRNVTVVDQTLTSAFCLASNYRQQAASTTTAATQAVSHNLSAIRERLANERTARAQQVVAAAALLQAKVGQVVEANPVLKSTITTTSSVANQALNIAAEKWKSALQSSKSTIDAILPDDGVAAAPASTESTSSNDDTSLIALSSTVSRRVRARANKVVNQSAERLSSVRSSVRQRLDVQYHIIASKLEPAQLEHLVNSLPLPKQLTSKLDAAQIQAIQNSLSQQIKQLQNQTESVKSIAVSRYNNLTNSTMVHARSAIQHANEGKDLLWNKVNESKHMVVDFSQHLAKDGVVSTVKPALTQVTATVQTTVQNVKGLVYAKVQLAFEWSKTHAKPIYDAVKTTTNSAASAPAASA